MPRDTSVGLMVSAGPSGALVRSTARSKSGSNSTVVALYALLPISTCVLPSLSPATTCALVATSPGPTTKPEPSCSLLHAVPRTLTVEKMAGSAKAFVWALVGVETAGVEGGVSDENTCGKPWPFRKVWRSLKMEGAWGSTPSMEWRMSERATGALSEVNRLLGDRITAATTQTESRTAMTATATPRTASTVPRWWRRTVTLLQVPMTRPA